MNTIYGDYRVIAKLGRRNNNQYYRLKCVVCGHEKECGATNLLKQDNHHSKLNCKEDYYAPYIGQQFGDYVITDISLFGNKGYCATIKCVVCGHTVEHMPFTKAIEHRHHSAYVCHDDYHRCLIGKTFGDLIVTEVVGHNNDVAMLYKCKCVKCGTESIELMQGLKKLPKHGAHCFKRIPPSPYKDVIAQRFWNMYQRCNNPNNNNYKHYGGRGIRLCYESPVDLYLDFYDEMVEFSKTHKLSNSTFDRIDVNGNYEKNNLRVTDHCVQSTNTRRKKVFILSKGNERVLSDSSAAAAKHIGSTASAVGNVVRGASKTCNGWRLHKLVDVGADLNKVSRDESVTTKLIVT